MTPLRIIFLTLAIWGGIHPMFYFLRWFGAHGFDLAGMAKAWNVNDASSGLVWDLTISAIALTVFVLAEVIRMRNWVGLLAIPATFCIGVSCGLPLYLFLRSRPAMVSAQAG